jgi:hypothetical protein
MLRRSNPSQHFNNSIGQHTGHIVLSTYAGTHFMKGKYEQQSAANIEGKQPVKMRFYDLRLCAHKEKRKSLNALGYVHNNVEWVGFSLLHTLQSLAEKFWFHTLVEIEVLHVYLFLFFFVQSQS